MTKEQFNKKYAEKGTIGGDTGDSLFFTSNGFNYEDIGVLENLLLDFKKYVEMCKGIDKVFRIEEFNKKTEEWSDRCGVYMDAYEDLTNMDDLATDEEAEAAIKILEAFREYKKKH